MYDEPFEKAVTDKPWDGSKARFTVEQLLRSVPRSVAAWARRKARAESRDVTKNDLKLPYKEPNGTINLGAVRNALSVLGGGRGGVQLPPDVRAAAKRELEGVLERHGSTKKSWGGIPLVLEKNAVVWKGRQPLNECCFASMDDFVAAGHRRDCHGCENILRAQDGLMEKECLGDISDFEKTKAPERELMILYFRKSQFLTKHTIERWQVGRRMNDATEMLRVGHETENLIDLSTLRETEKGWIARFADEKHQPKDPVFARIDNGVIGMFDVVE
jgi:hypothetical protein